MIFLLFISHAVLGKDLLKNISSTTDVSEPLEGRIVGGHNCGIESYPYVVSIRSTVNYRHRCGGTLISKFWVLTAGHCAMRNYTRGSYTVVAGISAIYRRMTRRLDIQSSLVVRNYLPANFDIKTLRNDIALMELEYPITESRLVKYVKLASYANTVDAHLQDICKSGVVVGWGEQFRKGKDGRPISVPIPPHNSYLQCITLPVITYRACESIYSRSIPTTVFCANGQGKEPCQGDSGGPLVCNNVQYGIVSSGVGCGYRYPGIYTRVDKYEAFIQDIMSRNSCHCLYIDWLMCCLLCLTYVFL